MTNKYIRAVACKYFNLCQNRNIIYVCVANNTQLLSTELFSVLLMGLVVLKSCKPAVWWKEVKNLSGFAPPAHADPLVDFQHVVGGQGEPPKDSRFLANLINSSFLSPMIVFEPLSARPNEHNNAAPVEPRPRLITEYSVLQKLRTLNPNKASGPDQIPPLASQR